MIFDVINKLKIVDKYIKQEKTGSRKDFASRLHLSKNQLYYYIDFLKENGADVKFSRKNHTYYYNNNIEVNIELSIKVIEDSDLKKYKGGYSIHLESFNYIQKKSVTF